MSLSNSAVLMSGLCLVTLNEAKNDGRLLVVSIVSVFYKFYMILRIYYFVFISYWYSISALR